LAIASSFSHWLDPRVVRALNRLLDLLRPRRGRLADLVEQVQRERAAGRTRAMVAGLSPQYSSVSTSGSIPLVISVAA
jgi:hypothetical protein